MAVGMIKIIHSLKTGAVLAALLTTGMAGGNMQKQDLWQFIAKMSASLKTLSVNSLDNAPLSFRLTKQNEYINFYKADYESERQGAGTLITFHLAIDISHPQLIELLENEKDSIRKQIEKERTENIERERQKKAKFSDGL